MSKQAFNALIQAVEKRDAEAFRRALLEKGICFDVCRSCFCFSNSLLPCVFSIGVDLNKQFEVSPQLVWFSHLHSVGVQA